MGRLWMACLSAGSSAAEWLMRTLHYQVIDD
jgi:hypothetical protein